jgi:hypothetical protein
MNEMGHEFRAVRGAHAFSRAVIGAPPNASKWFGRTLETSTRDASPDRGVTEICMAVE